MSTLEKLTDKRDKLYEWLEQAESKINAGKATGSNVEEAEEKWYTNLRRYEQVCDQIRDVRFS